MYLTWRLIEEYGWLGDDGSIAPLGMEEVRRLTRPQCRLDATLYRMLVQRRHPADWEHRWDARARVDPPLQWRVNQVRARAATLQSLFMEVCTLVMTYAYGDPADARTALERIEGRVAAWKDRMERQIH